jgi:hypothetical protein
MDFIQGTSAASTTCTELAALLGTLGIPRHAEKPLEVLVGDVEQVCFIFEAASTDGEYQTANMIRAWTDPHFPCGHPRHPLTYVRAAFHSRRALLGYAKERMPCGIVARGPRLEAIRIRPEHAVPPPPLRCGAIPDAATTPALHTECVELACALLACGIPLWSPLPVTREDKRLVFFFHPSDPTGDYNTRQLMLAWEDATWHLQHPEHPFSYLWCAFENRRRLMTEVRSHSPTVCLIQANGLPAFIPLHASAELETKFTRALKH